MNAPIDAIVIGGGVNGLTCAALLGRAGLKPLVLEALDTCGGGARTGEIVPGFRAPTLSHTTGPLRPVFASIGVTGRLLAKVFPRLGPELNALVRTTAVVTELAGAAGANVLATSARASVNVRLLPGDTAASAAARIRRVIADRHVEVEVASASEPSPVSPWTGPAWDRLVAATASALGEDVVPTPYIQLGASDSRWFTEISDHVYRFTPFHLTRGEREALHSHNERIRVGSWLRGIEFYRDLLRAG